VLPNDGAVSGFLPLDVPAMLSMMPLHLYSTISNCEHAWWTIRFPHGTGSV
jgi:hypothetical protein